tara:strand:+ start:961 stop:1191 length:231 start_codon:yes stop_codon:yes gene_type:complete
MSRGLSEEQKKHIRNEVKRNKLIGYDNPYEIATNIFFKVQELNDFETYFDDVKSFLDDLEKIDYKKTYMAKEFGYK